MIEKEQAIALKNSANYAKFEKLLLSDIDKMKEDLVNVDIDGLQRIDTFNGRAARMVAHEIDHLNGKLIWDHALKQVVRPMKRRLKREAQKVNFSPITPIPFPSDK